MKIAINSGPCIQNVEFLFCQADQKSQVSLPPLTNQSKWNRSNMNSCKQLIFIHGRIQTIIQHAWLLYLHGRNCALRFSAHPRYLYLARNTNWNTSCEGNNPQISGLGPALVSSLLCSQLLIPPNQIDPDKTIINSCRKLVFQPPSRTRVYVYVQIPISSLVTRAHGASHKILNTCPILDA